MPPDVSITQPFPKSGILLGGEMLYNIFPLHHMARLISMFFNIALFRLTTFFPKPRTRTITGTSQCHVVSAFTNIYWPLKFSPPCSNNFNWTLDHSVQRMEGRLRIQIASAGWPAGVWKGRPAVLSWVSKLKVTAFVYGQVYTAARATHCWGCHYIRLQLCGDTGKSYTQSQRRLGSEPDRAKGRERKWMLSSHWAKKGKIQNAISTRREGSKMSYDPVEDRVWR